MHRASAVLAIALLSIVLAACASSAPTPAPAPVDAGDPVTIDIVAKDIAFEPATVAVPAGAPLRVRLDNRDDGIPHNVALFGDAQFSTNLAEGEITTGPSVTELDIPGLIPGLYQFRCTIHPNMTASLEVSG